MENKYNQNPILLVMLLMVALFLVVDVAISIGGLKDRSEIRENQRLIMNHLGIKPARYDNAVHN